MSLDGKNISGLLLECPGRIIQRSDLLKSSRISYEDRVDDSSWEKFILESRVPLHGEDPTVLHPPFRYPVVCRRSGSRILVLSLTRAIVEHLVDIELQTFFSPPLRRVSIAVDQLVKNISSRPTEYALSFAHARVPAFGASLRAISFYGEDLAEAALFRDQLSLMVFFTCGLRQAHGSGEIIRLGGDGSVSFFLNSSRRVVEVERTLSFLRKEGYLTSEFWAE